MKRLLLLLALPALLPSCLNKDYDLGEISLKMTVGTSGVTIPLGKFEKLTVDSLVKRSELEDLIPDGDFYAYKVDDRIEESIDAITIDPIRDIIPAIDPYTFRFSDSSLPESFQVDGLNSSVAVTLPTLDFGHETFEGIEVYKYLKAKDFIGITLPANTPVTLPTLDEQADFDFSLGNIPDEVAAVKKITFGGGSASGTLVEVEFSPEEIAKALKNAKISLALEFPSAYTLRLNSNYDGHASISGSTFRLKEYPANASTLKLSFYLAARVVNETISGARILEIKDQIHYTLDYSGVAKGTPIEVYNEPLFTFKVVPELDDVTLLTNDITPDPTATSTDVAFDITGLEGISQINYIAFLGSASNALTLRASQPNVPLRNEAEVRITFPAIFEFGSNITGLSGNVLTTTMSRLSSAGGVTLPLKGIRLTGDDTKVSREGIFSLRKQIDVLVTPRFPGDEYTLSALKNIGTAEIGISVDDMTLRPDLANCEMTAGFSHFIDISQAVDETFDVPKEVAGITYAEVVDNAGLGAAAVTISLGIQNSPVDHFYFDDIEIVLPSFIEAEHTGLNPETNTIHIDRIEYTGKMVDIAGIVLKGIKDIPIKKTAQEKLAELKGEIKITATINVPDGTPVDGLTQEDITLLPKVHVSDLKVKRVRGSLDLDLQEYLKPTTIDLNDIRESLGDKDIEINLVAPQITLEVENPVGVRMVGDITLQPYNFADEKLDPVVVKNVAVEAAKDDEPLVTKLYVTDGAKAPEGYTLCRVDALSNLVKTIPSKIDVSFDLRVDDNAEQHFTITGQDYAFNVDYLIKLPLKFKDNASITYSDTADVEDAFDEIDKYEITADDILIKLNAVSTLPIGLDVTVEFLNADGSVNPDVTATVLGQIVGFDPASGKESQLTQLDIRVDLKDGNVSLLQSIKEIRYNIEGQAVGTGAGLSPRQYVSANLKVVLKKGISFDLDEIL